MAVQIDENFLIELGLGNAPDEKKRQFVQKTAETLEMRVGTRLVNELSDEQVDEFETLTPAETDSLEVVAEKHQKMVEWLGKNYPQQEEVIDEEFAKLKAELKAGVDAITSNGDSQQ